MHDWYQNQLVSLVSESIIIQFSHLSSSYLVVSYLSAERMLLLDEHKHNDISQTAPNHWRYMYGKYMGCLVPPGKADIKYQTDNTHMKSAKGKPSIHMNHSCSVGCCYMSLCMRKPTICISENKVADQLRGDRDHREADQRLCFRYTDSTISLLLKSEISSF